MLGKYTQMVERIRRCGESVEEGGAQLMTQLKVVGTRSWKDRPSKVDVEVVANLW